MQTKQNICLDCGLCCDGTFFGKVKVTPTEESNLFEVLNVKIETPIKHLVHPCPGYDKGCCQIYESRPQACRDYICSTLKDFNDDKVSEMDATRRISEAKQKRNKLRAYLTSVTDWDISVSFLTNTNRFEQKCIKEMGAQEFRKLHGGFLLELYHFKRFLWKNFKVPYQSKPEKTSSL